MLLKRSEEVIDPAMLIVAFIDREEHLLWSDGIYFASGGIVASEVVFISSNIVIPMSF